jgi:hypothetical protein
MKSAAIARLESVLQGRKLDVTIAPAWAVPSGDALLPCGVAAIDAQLGGGWRRGEVSEILGPRSSGRTSVLLATMAAATSRGEIVGLVDATDRFDPASALEAGVDLDRVLWVRGPARTVEFERKPAPTIRRGRARGPDTVESSLIQRAVRAFDLILRAGNFGVVALDIADVPMHVVRTLPWTTWMRLAHASEGTKTVALLVGDGRMGKSARGTSLVVSAPRTWNGSSAQSKRFTGFDLRRREIRDDAGSALKKDNTAKPATSGAALSASEWGWGPAN